MIGWLTRRLDQGVRERAGRILAALEDGAPHCIVGDLDRATGHNAASLHAPLAYLEQHELVESGWADLGPERPRRRWYRIKKEPK